MLWRGPIGGGAASGRIGSMVASRNNSGQYMRSRVVPVNPRTSRQTDVRSVLSHLSSLYSAGIGTGALDQIAWQVYADNLVRTNRLGDRIKLTATNGFQIVNFPRVFLASLPTPPVGINQLLVPPPDSIDAGITPPYAIVQTSAGIDSIDISFGNDGWTGEAGGALLFYIGHPVNPGFSAFQKRYRFGGFIQGDVLVAPTSPTTFTAVLGATWGIPAAPPAGMLIPWKITVIDDVGRVNTTQYGDFTTL